MTDAASIVSFREQVIQKLEARASDMWKKGECKRWLASAPPHVKRISQDVCGPMLELLVAAVDHPDKGCSEMFRMGNAFPCWPFCLLMFACKAPPYSGTCLSVGWTKESNAMTWAIST